jgi:hypothetical protein
MTDRRNDLRKGMAGAFVFVGVLGAVVTDANGHDTIFKVCDIGQNYSVSTPTEDERFLQSRGAALMGAMRAWADIVLEETASVRPPPDGINRDGQPLAGYDDFSHAMNRTMACNPVEGAEARRQWICEIAGEPCFEVNSCNDPAIVGLECGEDLES